jgi:4-hydroxybenzoate polyprenyltransferase
MLKRILIYLKEMFPASSFVGSMMICLSVELIYLRLNSFPPGFELRLLVPAFVVTMVSLLIRIMDEFKDYQDDLTNFPDRPLPSGRVTKKDLLYLAGFCVLSIFGLSLQTFNMFVWGVITLCFTGLMLKWFFIEERMRKSLPLAFISHHPIVLINFLYLIIACRDYYLSVTLDKCFYVLPLCFIFTNWEISRKIRAPGQETQYTTYSKIWGARNATRIAIGLQGIVILCMFSIFSAIESPYILRIAFFLCEAFLLFPYLKFLKTLELTSPFKQNAETQILTIIGFLFVASFL